LASAGAEWTLDIYGEGPEAGRLRRRAERLGVADRVRLLGQRPREDVLSALASADVLLFPSMHDPSPFIVAEAVSLGCPVVCLDVGGPPLLIAGTTGEAVPPDGRAPERLAEAMNRVRRHPPNGRWSSDRLPKLVTEWYEAAVANVARRPRQSG
jgi:glycosyltransferase involved in cell wall biosynthesis